MAVFPRRGIAATMGLALGALIGFLIAFFKDRNKAVFRVPGESQRFLDVDEIGVIPSLKFAERPALSAKNRTLLATSGKTASDEHPAVASARWGDNFSIVAEAYRNAMLSIALGQEADKARVYIVSSPNAGEGKTTVTSNLGIALSKSKLRVVLVDGDLRRPNLHRVLSVPNTAGLREVLRGQIDVTNDPSSSFLRPTNYPNLFVVPAGTGKDDPIELLHSDKFDHLLDRLAEEFDVILVDTPPMLHMADARILARQANGAILIFRAGSTTRDQAMNARDLLDHDHVRLVGTILNDFNPSREGKSDYYSSYYQYQEADMSGRAAVNH